MGLSNDSPFIFVPISGPVKERAYITGLLRKIVMDMPSEYQIVMSLGYPNYDGKPIKKGNVTIYGWVPNRFEYLKACDLVISKAGHGTLTQSMSYGKPMILIPTPSHTEQLNNAYRLKELGVAEVLEQHDVNKETLLRMIRKMMNDDSYRRRMDEIHKDISKLNGLKTAVEMIMRVAETH